MGTLFCIKSPGVGLPPGQKILRAAEQRVLTEADSLLRRAQAEADVLLRRAEEVYAAEKQRGYEEGLVRGKAEMAERMIHSVISSVDQLEKMEDMMVDVVMAALEKILDGIDSRERAVALVRKALNYVRGQKKVLIRIPPDDLDAVQQALEDILRDSPDMGIVEIAADARLERGACLLESDLGMIDASLETQLESIRRAFRQHLGGAFPRI